MIPISSSKPSRLGAQRTEGKTAYAMADSLGEFAFKAGCDAICGNLNAEWHTRRSSMASVGYTRVSRVGCTFVFCILMVSRGFVCRDTRGRRRGPSEPPPFRMPLRPWTHPFVFSSYDETPFL